MAHIIDPTGSLRDCEIYLECLQEEIQESRKVFKRPEKKEILELLHKINKGVL